MRHALLFAVLVACQTASDSGETSSSPPSGTETAVGSTGTDDTWDSFAQGFFADYCVECHADAPRDFTQQADVVANGDEIRCGVGTTVLSGCSGFPPPEQFPVGDGPKPSDAERDRLVAWVEAGMP